MYSTYSPNTATYCHFKAQVHKSLYNLIILLNLSVYVYLCRGWFFSRAVPAKEVHVREDLDIPKNGQLKISTY